MEGLGINPGLLLLQILSFFLVFVILRKWLFSPLANTLEKRRNTIAQGQEDARVAAEARANAEQEATRIIADAQAKSAHIVNEATERAEKVVLEVKAEADKEIIKQREATLAEVAEERNRMLGDLRGQVAALAIVAAQKLLGESLDEKRQHALLEGFFSGVKSGKVVILEGEKLSGTSAEVTSALPLTADEQTILKRDVLTKMGTQTTVTFRVNPAILGGLVIRVGDKVLDDSIAGKVEGLRQSLR
ncbi:MAG: F0F1 ATP synthase subunit B [Anaerolineales bacterium]|nr:F0F1 ATP synthase subunit B [Anaerolineales bacterium]